jgi:DNA-binding response OmpR family regulator
MVPEEILIVNDGSLLLKLMGDLLAKQGHQVSLTDSPEEALPLLSSRNIIQVVVKLNGRQTDRRVALMHTVKELDAATRLVIVGDQTGLPAEAFEVEADDYVLQPCRLPEVWRRLTLCLDLPPCQVDIVPGKTWLPPLDLGRMSGSLSAAVPPVHASA